MRKIITIIFVLIFTINAYAFKSPIQKNEKVKWTDISSDNGPRQTENSLGSYDFHKGIDFKGSLNSDVYAIEGITFNILRTFEKV